MNKILYRFLSVLCVIVLPCQSEFTNCSIYNSVDITNGYKINENILFNKVLYEPNYYFLSNITYDYSTGDIKNVDNHVRGCLCDIPEIKCIRLCCPINNIWSVTQRQCVLSKHIPFDNYNEWINSRRTIYGKPCKTMYQLTAEEAFLNDNGILEEIDDESENTKYTHDRYCMTPTQGGYTDNGEIDPSNNEINFIYNVCIDPEYNVTENDDLYESNDEELKDETKPVRSTFKYKIYPAATIISIIFLFVAFLIYSCVPDLRNLHGKCVLCYICGLIVGYTILTFIQLGGSKIIQNKYFCIGIGFAGVHAFLFSFLCLNVMCLDIYITFKGFGTTKKMSDRRKFLFYSLYTWGITLILLIYAICMQFNGYSTKYSPRIGQASCWIKKQWELELMYLYLPIAVILFINITLFVITACTIRKLQRESEMFHGRGDSRKHSLRNDRDKFGLFIRLFIVMGITWSLEIISWIVVTRYGDHWFAYIPDICNALQGIFIFVFVLWKPKVKLLVIKRFRHLFGCDTQRAASTRNTSIKSTTSHSSSVGVIIPSQDTTLTTESIRE